MMILRKRSFRTVYVDAFAGTGDRKEEEAVTAAELLPEFEEPDTQQFFKGSARLVLEMDQGFDEHIFVEASARHVEALKLLKQEFPSKSVQIRQADANVFLQEWCKQTDWKMTRAVVFLDPYGMQVEWATLSEIARTRAIDLWLLFPLGIGVNRLLTNRKQPPAEWACKLTAFFGTDSWKTEFYKTSTDLFGDTDSILEKDAPPTAIRDFFLTRLKTIFADVAPNPRILTNSRGSWLYLLVFAVGNPHAVKPALDIANYLLKKDYGGQLGH